MNGAAVIYHQHYDHKYDDKHWIFLCHACLLDINFTLLGYARGDVISGKHTQFWSTSQNWTIAVFFISWVWLVMIPPHLVRHWLSIQMTMHLWIMMRKMMMMMMITEIAIMTTVMVLYAS